MKTDRRKLVWLVRHQIRASKAERRRIERQITFWKSELAKLEG
jgi:hypothetical protein